MANAVDHSGFTVCLQWAQQENGNHPSDGAVMPVYNLLHSEVVVHASGLFKVYFFLSPFGVAAATAPTQNKLKIKMVLITPKVKGLGHWIRF
jgi:hypothetical protein